MKPKKNSGHSSQLPVLSPLKILICLRMVLRNLNKMEHLTNHNSHSPTRRIKLEHGDISESKEDSTEPLKQSHPPK